MKILPVLSILLLLCTVGCEKQSLNTLSEEVRIYIPNAFILDGPIDNDTFFPQSNFDDLIVEFMEVYDKFGNLIFLNEQFPINESSEGWDGRGDGINRVQPGSYTFSIKITDGEGVAFFRGEITVSI